MEEARGTRRKNNWPVMRRNDRGANMTIYWLRAQMRRIEKNGRLETRNLSDKRPMKLDFAQE